MRSYSETVDAVFTNSGVAQAVKEINEASGILALDVQSDDTDRAVSDYIKQIKEKNNNKDPLFGKLFDVNKQKEFADYLMDVMCYDKTRGLMKESEHPFTSGFGTTDVRVTNHYYEDLSLIHI